MSTDQLTPEQIDQQSDELGWRMVVIMRGLVAGHNCSVAVNALVKTAAILVPEWSAKGFESRMLIEASDYLANVSQRYPVERPQ